MPDLDFGLQPMTVTPLKYQADGFMAAVADFESGLRSVNSVLVTGSGKTILAGLVARWVIEEHDGRVLFLAHREELLNGCADDFARVGVDVLIERAGENARWGLWDPKCVAASVATLKGARLRSWPRDHFTLIVTDECHHAPADSYRAIYEWFDWRWHYGISAGIDRLDGESLGTVFQKVSYEYPYDRAVADGSICRAEFARVHTSADLSAIRTTGRDDLGPKQIEAAIGPHIAEMSKVAAAKLGHRRSLGFAPCVGSAVAFASAFNSDAIGIPAAAIHADTQDRAAVWDDFRHGKVRIVWNYMVATEGINLPFVSGGILARATKSRNLYGQMVGRTLRNFPGKESSLIVDFHWLSGEHELAGPTSLVDATNFDHGVLPLAESFIADGRESDLMRAIERAKTVHRKRADYRVKVDARKARFRCEMFDPLSSLEVMGMPTKRSGEVSNANQPTPGQVDLLAKMGVDDAERLGRHRASRLLDVLLGRAKQKLGTYRQVRKLQELGVDPAEARALTKAEASVRLDRLIPNRAG
jgi:superfamily II DNA or RNA helicase